MAIISGMTTATGQNLLRCQWQIPERFAREMFGLTLLSIE